MRLIDADAIKIPRTHEDIFQNCRNCMLLDEGQVREIIDNAPTIGGWVPVTERLPEIKECHTSDVCLCYCSNGAYCFGELEENILGQVGWNCERDDDYYEAVGEVIAWMLLPEPYKEQTERSE